MKSLASIALLTLISVNAWAGTPQLPEPGVLPLFAIGAIGGLAIWIRTRNKR